MMEEFEPFMTDARLNGFQRHIRDIDGEPARPARVLQRAAGAVEPEPAGRRLAQRGRAAAAVPGAHDRPQLRRGEAKDTEYFPHGSWTVTSRAPLGIVPGLRQPPVR